MVVLLLNQPAKLREKLELLRILREVTTFLHAQHLHLKTQHIKKSWANGIHPRGS